jgi:alpha-beta hydrolase superfamily lysophospholipase
MNTFIKKHLLTENNISVNALSFIPDGEIKKVAIFTHGYTSSKHSLTNWATRLCESQVAVTIFDLPGHYLGSYEELASFEDFTKDAPKLFTKAFNWLIKNHCVSPQIPLIIGGHSLGALMSLKSLSSFKEELNLTPSCILVGFGLNLSVKTHIFDSPFYEKTMNVRKQLVSKFLDPKVVFPWVKQQKLDLEIKDSDIFLLCGEDDVVVGSDGAQNLFDALKEHNNVKIIAPKKLPHHMPELAASHINSIVKNLN